MAHLTITIKAYSGQELFVSDFTLQEMIPLVRQVTRTLNAHYAYLRDELEKYRASITPSYELRPNPSEYVKPPDVESVDEMLEIPEATMNGMQDDLTAELMAFYYPGTSPLCVSCPERDRCPGSGHATQVGLDDWITLEVTDSRPGESIRWLTITIRSRDGELIYRRDFSIAVLQFFVNFVKRQLFQRGDLHANEDLIATFYAHASGTPNLSPVITALRSPRAASWTDDDIEAPIGTPGGLVDWDDIENDRPTDGFEIEILEEENPDVEPIYRALPDNLVLSEEEVAESNLAILIRREVLDMLYHYTDSAREYIGILVGNYCFDPQRKQSYVEIQAAFRPRSSFLVSSPSLTYGFWRSLDDRIRIEYPNKHIIGWFSLHRTASIVVIDTSQVGSAVVSTTQQPASLSLRPEELFMYKSFFREKWHVAGIVDAERQQVQFFRWCDQKIEPVSRFHIID